MVHTARHLVLALASIIVSDWWYIWHHAVGVGTIVADLPVPDPPLSHFGFKVWHTFANGVPEMYQSRPYHTWDKSGTLWQYWSTTDVPILPLSHLG